MDDNRLCAHCDYIAAKSWRFLVISDPIGLQFLCFV